MANKPNKPRPTMRELAAVKHREQVADMKLAIAEGRLKVRQMTPAERAESDARFAKRPAR